MRPTSPWFPPTGKPRAFSSPTRPANETVNMTSAPLDSALPLTFLGPEGTFTESALLQVPGAEAMETTAMISSASAGVTRSTDAVEAAPPST